MVKSYLADVLTQVGGFEKIQFVRIENRDGVTEAAGFAQDKQVLVLGRTDAKPEFDRPACLGHMDYLSKILSMEQIRGKDGTVKITTGPSIEGHDIIQRLDFSAPRLKVSYKATDPKVNNVVIPPVKQLVWAVTGKLEPDHSKQFNEMVGLRSVVDPKNDTFSAVGGKGGLKFLFSGKMSDEMEMVVFTEPTSAMAETKFPVSKVKVALGMMAKNGGGTLHIGEKAFKVAFKSPESEYEVIIPYRKEVDG